MTQPITKEILNGGDARTGLLKGINKVANAVGVTLGPMGMNVVIGKGDMMPITTKDGFTVAKNINLADRAERIGAKLIQGVAFKTVRDSGDGTTSATLLAQFLINEGVALRESGVNHVALTRGIEEAVEVCVQHLKSIAIEVESGTDILKHVATISANNDPEIGALIGDAFQKIGKNGVVSVKESMSNDTTIEVVSGTRFPSGYLMPHFMNNFQKASCELNDPYILIYDGVINNAHKGFTNIMDAVNKAGGSLVVIADDVQNESLQIMVQNKIAGKFDSVAIKAPWASGFSNRKINELEDIAAITGGSVVSTTKGLKLEGLGLQHLGHCEKIIVTKDETTIIGGMGKQEAIDSRVALLETQIADEKDDNMLDVLKSRLSKLTGGMAVIYVGANSELEMAEKKDRIDDAIRATQSAIEEGVVEGGGTALLRCVDVLHKEAAEVPSFSHGFNLVARACEVQLRRLCANSGIDKSMTDNIIESVTSGHKGYNAKTGYTEDLIPAGIIDPLKVVRCAIENASSVAIMVLISDCVLVDEVVY